MIPRCLWVVLGGTNLSWINQFPFCCHSCKRERGGQNGSKSKGAFILSSVIYSLALSGLKKNAQEHMKRNKGSTGLDVEALVCVMCSVDGEGRSSKSERGGGIVCALASRVLISLLTKQRVHRKQIPL